MYFLYFVEETEQTKACSPGERFWKNRIVLLLPFSASAIQAFAPSRI
jgi:hypothetical protein